MIKPRLICTTFIYVLIAITSSLDTASADKIRTVALSGTPAPGVMGSNFDSFWSYALNSQGETAFWGAITGNHGESIWSEGGGSGLQLVARAGSLSPGISGARFLYFDTPAFNDQGHISFRSFYQGAGVNTNNNSGVWSEGDGNGLQPLALRGNPAPNTTNADFFNFGRLAMNNAGQTAFRGELTGTDITSNNNSGIWSGGGGSGLHMVAREGNNAPDSSSANFLELNEPVLNDVGQTAFRGVLTGSGITSSNNSGIWSEGGGNGLQIVAREGSSAPSTSGAFFSGFSDPVLNNAGQTAFWGTLTGTGVTSSNDLGLWSEGGGNGLQIVARSGNPAPGSSGAEFSNFFKPVINSSGHVAFLGSLTGTGITNSNDTGIWSEGGGSGLQLVARSGNPAPGTSKAVFDFLGHGSPALNGMGQSAFLGTLTGTGVDNTNDTGIWAEDPAGNLILVAREGDLLDVDDGLGTDFRTINDLGFSGDSGNEDGRATTFNDRGQLAFYATFTDGSSGVFVSNLVAIPEPTGIVLLALATMSLAARYRLICR